MTCRHKYIRTWVFEDTKEPSGLWSCVDCGLKFEPITQRTWVGMTDEEMTECIVVTCNTDDGTADTRDLIRAVEAKLKEKNT